MKYIRNSSVTEEEWIWFSFPFILVSQTAVSCPIRSQEFLMKILKETVMNVRRQEMFEAMKYVNIMCRLFRYDSIFGCIRIFINNKLMLFLYLSV